MVSNCFQNILTLISIFENRDVQHGITFFSAEKNKVRKWSLPYRLTQHCLLVWKSCNSTGMTEASLRPMLFSCKTMMLEVYKALLLQYCFFHRCYGTGISVGCWPTVHFWMAIIPFSLHLRALLHMTSIWYWLRRRDFNEIQNMPTKRMLNCNDSLVLVACDVVKLNSWKDNRNKCTSASL